MVGYQENGWRLTEAVEMAALVVPLVISFGAPFSIALGRKPAAGDDHASFAAGLYAGHVVMNSGGDSPASRSTSRRSAPIASSACRCASFPAAW